MHHAAQWFCMKQEDLWRAVEVNPDRAMLETNICVCVCVCGHGQIAKKTPNANGKVQIAAVVGSTLNWQREKERKVHRMEGIKARAKSLEKRRPFFSICVFSRMHVYAVEVLKSYFTNLHQSTLLAYVARVMAGYFQMAHIYHTNAILSSYRLVPFDATQHNQENVVIKIALLDYSDSKIRQWGSCALNAASSTEGVGGQVVLLLGYGTRIWKGGRRQ